MKCNEKGIGSSSDIRLWVFNGYKMIYKTVNVLVLKAKKC